MESIKTIAWRNIEDLAFVLSGSPFAANKQIPENKGGWCIRINDDYHSAKKGSVLYYNVYGGFITRVRKGFSDKAPLIFDKSVPLWVFAPKTKRSA